MKSSRKDRVSVPVRHWAGVVRMAGAGCVECAEAEEVDEVDEVKPRDVGRRPVNGVENVRATTIRCAAAEPTNTATTTRLRWSGTEAGTRPPDPRKAVRRPVPREPRSRANRRSRAIALSC